MDKTMMPSLTSMFLVAIVFAASFNPNFVSGEADAIVAHKFCVDILGQSKYDATQCLLKPAGYQMELGKDKAVLTYLCCLGTFNDVTHNYMPYMSQDLLLYVASMDSSTNLLNLASFVSQCKAPGLKVTTKDFLYWTRKGRKASVCKLAWRKK